MMRGPFWSAPVGVIPAGAFLLSACSAGMHQALPSAPATTSGSSPNTSPQVVLEPSTASNARIVWTHVQKLLPSSTARTPLAVNSPFNLTFFGGPVVKHTVSSPVYINAPSTTWGTPGRGTPSNFLARFGLSGFVHIADQYTFTTANDRYTAGRDINLTVSLPHTIGLSKIVTILHAVAAVQGAGPGHVYHLFLKPCQDVCLAPGVCYSPDRPSTFVFCAFHASVTFSDIGEALVTVEPFQFVSGCAIPTAVPHGVIDATTSTLSHELMETITDPNGNAWFNVLFGAEIGDLCLGFHDDDNIDGAFYDIQEEYSNTKNACTNSI